MTPTEEIEQWIEEHGCVRDALNVALGRLEYALRNNEALKDELRACYGQLEVYCD